MRLLLGLLIGGYLLSGVYLIRGNEQGIVRRFGRLDPRPIRSGLHYDLPAPFSRVDRINRAEARTLLVGVETTGVVTATARGARPASPTNAAAGRLSTPQRPPERIALDRGRQPEFLTGDKNIVHLQVQVQYLVDDVAAWVLAHESPEQTLKRTVESRLCDLVAECGIDFVHPLGLPVLQQMLAAALRNDGSLGQLGVLIDDVAIPQISPPVEVKAAFLDVSTARAERDQLVARERVLGEQRVAAAEAEALTRQDRAQAERVARVEGARARADATTQLLAALDAQSPSPDERTRNRGLLLRRLFLEFLEKTLPTLRRVAFLEPGARTDLWLPAEGLAPPTAPASIEGSAANSPEPASNPPSDQ